MHLFRTALAAIITILVFSLVQPSLPVSVAQKVWTVNANGPADYDTIQKAVNVASVGDTILVMPGNYNETEINKKVDIVGQPSGGNVFSVRLSSLGISKGASGASLQFLYAPNVTVSTGAHDVRFDGVGGGYTLSNSFNISINAGSGSITATNVTHLSIERFSGQIQGTTLNHTSYADSSGGFTLGGDNLAMTGDSGQGTVTGNFVNVSNTVGQLTMAGHTINLKNSLLSLLTVTTGDNSTFSTSKFTGPVAIGGKKLNFTANEVNFGSLTVDGSSANSTISNNRFLNSTVSVQAPGVVFDQNVVSNAFTNKSQTLPLPGSIYDVDFPSSATLITFTGNDVMGLEGVHIGSCAKVIKDNYVHWAGFRPYINDTLLVIQNGMQTTGMKLGDTAGGSCTDPKGSVTNGTKITLNKIAGFYYGVSIAFDRSLFETNEVGANHTNIKVTGANNTLIENNFLGNATNIDDGQDNKWYQSEGSSGKGNYWQDWANNNANEIGGITRALALNGKGNNAVDRYPLARPVPLLEQTVVPEFSANGSMLLMIGIAGAISVFAILKRSADKNWRPSLF